ncbi:MAG TPA: DUF4434 domain-containing protein [Stenomitos sp.]
MEIRPLQSLLQWLHPRPAATPESRPAVQGDQLKLSTEARSAQTVPNRLGGSFLQVHGNGESAEYWEKTLADMKRVGMDTAIIQFNQYDGNNFSEATERILTAADKLGMKVMVGTALNEGSGTSSWYVRQYMPWEVKKEGESVAAYTKQLVGQFAKHPSMAGVYIPFEVNGLANPKVIGDFYGAIAKAAKEERPDLKVMISPYTNWIPGVAMSSTEKGITEWWDTVLSRAPIDIVAWQDGVGASNEQLHRVSHDLGALAKATENHGVELWANLEAFQRTSKLTEGFAAGPASIDRLKKQIDASGSKVTKLISFDFNDYMSPQAGEAEAKLYDDYQHYVEGLDPSKP